jgi:catechol O-methyltransferase
LRRAGGKEYLSFELNPEFAAVAMSLVDLAGLHDFVKIVVGPGDVSVKRLRSSGALQQVDLLFLDHYKPAYLGDLKLFEQLDLIKPGSVLAADNVIKPGNPPYLEYVRASPEVKRSMSTKLHAANAGDKTQVANVKGNPNLVYESQLVHSFEPSGVPVSARKSCTPFIEYCSLTCLIC